MNMYLRFTLLVKCVLLFSALFITALASENRTEQYIEKYKDLAIAEMERSGIPASIKLAQGILESGSGQSRLATKGNNHFGIKCPGTQGEWRGEYMRHDDDEAQECFRVYSDPKKSWKDHTEFLTEGWRYQSLFELDPTDYEAWAHGLREAGYATNPMYANLLIQIIERHELYVYDREGVRGRHIAERDADDPDDRIFEFNGIDAVEVREGETYADITDQFLYFNYQLARYNDLEQGADLEAGTIVYLKPKRWRPSESYHTVREGETMHEISQMYGVRLGRLYRRNRMDQDAMQEPAVGEKVHLRSRRSEPPQLRSPDEKLLEDTRNYLATAEPDESERTADEAIVEHVHVVRENDDLQSLAEQFDVRAEDIKDWNGLPDERIFKGELLFMYISQDKIPGTAGIYHRVRPGETLYSIARQYEVTVDELRQMNNLETDNLPVDLELKVR